MCGRGVGVEKEVKMRWFAYGSILALLVAATVAVPSPVAAQAEAPKVVQVTVVQVEGADQDAFMERIAKAQAIWKELGMPAFRAWQSTLAGPNTGSVVFVTEYDHAVAWAQGTQKLAGSEKWQQWIDDLQAWRKTSVTSSSMLVEVTP
jgi:hypothetical protein